MRVLNALKSRAYAIGMLLIGLGFITLGVQNYPAFLVVGLFYVYIGLRGFRLAPRRANPVPISDKAQFESL